MEQKPKSKPKLKPRRILSDLAALGRMLRAWTGGRYQKVPWPTLLAIVGGAVYFFSPIDLIPDFIPVIGYLDDATVIALAVRAMRRDLGRFLDWEQAALAAG